MNTNKLTNLLKLGLPLFGICLFLLSCEKVEEMNTTNITENKTPNYTLEKINYTALIEDKEIEKSLPLISNKFFRNKNKNTFDKKGVVIAEGLRISTNLVHKITSGDVITWTFKIEKPLLEASDFENFLVEKNNNIFKYYLISYKIDAKNDKNVYETITSYPISAEYLNTAQLDLQTKTARKYNFDMIIDGGAGSGGCQPDIYTEIDACNQGGKHTNKYCCQHSDRRHGCKNSLPCGNSCSGTTITVIIDFSKCFGGVSPPKGPSNGLTNPGINSAGGSGGGGTDSSTNGNTLSIPLTYADGSGTVTASQAAANILNELLGNTLTTKQLDFLSLNSNYYLSNKITNFLGSSPSSLEKNFAIEAIKAKMKNNDVEIDFDLEMILEITETIAFQNETCLKKIKDDVMKTKQITKVIKKFEPENAVLHLEWGLFNSTNYFNAGHTVLNDEQTTAFININKASLSKASNIKIVATIAHEIIHAELFRKLKELVENNNVLSLSEYNALKNNFPGIADYTLRYGKVEYSQDFNGNVITYGLTPDFSLAHHNQMATFYRKTLIDVMKAYDEQHGNDRGNNSEEFYEAISWGGLRGFSENGIINYYDAWKNFKAKIDIDEANIPASQRTYNKYSTIINQQYDNQGINCN